MHGQMNVRKLLITLTYLVQTMNMRSMNDSTTLLILDLGTRGK